MELKAGIILQSSSLMEDIEFIQRLVFITEYNADGAMGFVIDNIFDRTLNELAEFSSSLPYPLYRGGPVDNEHLYFLHRRNDVITGGDHVTGDIYLGGDFTAAVAQINNHSLDTNHIKIFVGYCGWDANELEAEIAEGSWIISDKSLDAVFELSPNDGWQRKLAE